MGSLADFGDLPRAHPSGNSTHSSEIAKRLGRDLYPNIQTDDRNRIP